MRTAFWGDPLPIRLVVNCRSCGAAVELTTAGLGGTMMYTTYNEYACPACGKRNVAQTPGGILAARVVPASG
jgi:predicted RNA-binding Zn-ribbon protein involved in translation (DUF1610 family)